MILPSARCRLCQKVTKSRNSKILKLWKLSIKLLQPNEIIAMKDLLGSVRTWVQNIQDLPSDFQWLELDIKEMFPELPRDDIVPALKHLHKKIKQKTKSSSRLYFYLSKDGCRQMDTSVSSPRATHWALLLF